MIRPLSSCAHGTGLGMAFVGHLQNIIQEAKGCPGDQSVPACVPHLQSKMPVQPANSSKDEEEEYDDAERD